MSLLGKMGTKANRSGGGQVPFMQKCVEVIMKIILHERKGRKDTTED